MKLYEAYLYDESERFVANSIANATIEARSGLGEDNDVVALPSGVDELRAKQYEHQAYTLYGVHAALAVLIPSASGLALFMGSDTVGLMEPLIPLSEEHGKDIRSPELSRKKLLTIRSPELLVRILLSLEADRDTWSAGTTGDASKYFRNPEGSNDQ